MSQTNSLNNNSLAWLTAETISQVAQYKGLNPLADQTESPQCQDFQNEISTLLAFIFPDEEPSSSEKKDAVQRQLLTIYIENQHITNTLPNESLYCECAKNFREPASPETVFSFSENYASSRNEGEAMLQLMPVLLHLKTMPSKTLQLYTGKNSWENVQAICKNHIAEIAQTIQIVPNTCDLEASSIYKDCMNTTYSLLTSYLKNLTNQDEKIVYLRDAAKAHEGVLFDSARSAALCICEMSLVASADSDESETSYFMQEAGW